MKKKFFRSIAHYLPQTLLLISILTSNVLFPAIVIAQEVENINEANTVTQEETVPIDTSEDILEEGISTSIYEQESIPEIQIPPFTFENGIYTVNNVIPEEEYIYPENDNVRVKFTEVTQEGNLIIKRVELTEEQKELLNTKDSYGWDITSSMSNGTFKYNLTLPNTQGNEDIEVKYTEDNNTYESIDNSNIEIKSNVVTIEGLDHFTIFVVVDDGDNGYTDTGWTSNGSGYNLDHRYASNNQSGQNATWAYTGDPIANGAIFISWTQWADHATHAKYTFTGLSNDSNTAPSTIYVNQVLNSGQSATDGSGVWSGWYRVPGIYSIAKNATVTLASNLEGGNLSADAVAFVDLSEVPNEVWVDDNYSYNNSGEHFWGYDAFNNIQGGVSAVANNGTVHVASGTYSETINIGKPLSLRGVEGGNKPTILGGVTINTSGKVTIENINFKVPTGTPVDSIHINNINGELQLDVRNCSFDGSGLFLNGKRGIQSDDSQSKITVESSTFSNGYYIAIQGYYNELEVLDSTISNCKSGINFQGGNNLKVTNTNISVIAQGVSNDTYAVRFASDGTNSSGKDMILNGGEYVVDKNGYTADSNTYHSAIIARSGASGTLTANNLSLVGDVVNLSGVKLDATKNWWGDLNPSDNIKNRGTGSIDYSPWWGGNYVGNAHTTAWTWYTNDSIQDAVNVATNGDTINVLPGTYTEGISINKGITLKAIENAVVNGGIFLDTSNITIEGFEILNGATVAHGEKAGIYIKGGTSNQKIVNNTLLGRGSSVNGWSAIMFGKYTSNVLIQNNIIKNWYRGSYINPTNPFSNLEISKNTFDNNYVGIGSDGLNDVSILENIFKNNTSKAFGSSVAGNNVKIIGNEIYANGSGGVSLENVSNSEISNNYIYNNGGYGVNLKGINLVNAKVFDNVIKDNDYGIVVDSNVPNDLVIYNNTFNNTVNAQDDGSHYFDNGSIGNFWSNYDGLDLDGDGIGDTKDYVIDTNSSDRYPLTENYISVDVTDVSTNKDYYKKGDPLFIKVDVKNDGLMAFDPTKEKLVVNITDPSDSYISGAFRGVHTLSLQSQGTETVNFYVDPQTIPSDWPEGNYRVHVSVYSTRVPLGYLTGGQNSDTTFIVDNTPPTKPTGLQRKNGSGETFACGSRAQKQAMIPDWDDITNDPSFSHFEYSSFNADGSQGKDEMILYTSEFESGWVAPVDGTYGYTVRSVDKAGNKSAWAYGEETLEGSCQITYDSIGPVVTLTSPEDNYYTNRTSVHQEWTTTATDVDHYEYRSCKNNPSVDGVCTPIYSVTTENQYRNVHNNNISFWWQVRGIDNAGNIGEWSEPRKITIDTIAPKVDITSHNEGDIVKGEITITGEVRDLNLSHYWFVMTNSLGTTVAGPGKVQTSDNPAQITLDWNTENLPDGEYTIKLEARDLADNKDNGSSVEWVKIVVDKTAPITTLTDDLSGKYINQPILIKGVSTDNQSGIDYVTLSYRLTDSEDDWTVINTDQELVSTNHGLSFDWEYEWTPTFDGTYDIKVSATDIAGNTEQNTEQDTYISSLTYDSTAPSITVFIDSGTLNISTNDLLSGTDKIEVKINDDGAWIPYTTGMNLNTILNNTPGTYTIYARVTDKAGNPTEDSMKYTIPQPASAPAPTQAQAQIPATMGGAVLGATTTNTTTKTTTKGITKTTSPISTTQTEEIEILETTSIEEPSVLGESCENKKKVSGYVYIDKNKDKEMNENEEGIKDITLTIQYTDEEGNIKTEEEVSTDEKGYWETQLCSGKYNIVVKQDTLPKNIEVPEVLSLTVSDNEKETIFNIQALDTRNFWQKYWYLIVGGLVIIAIGYISIKNRKKEEI